MEFPHPDIAAGDVQIIYWSAFKLNVVYELELVSYFKAPTKAYAKGAYTDFFAVSLGDYEQPLLTIGDEFCMSISYKEYVRALQELHPSVRKAMQQNTECNAVIKFIKTSLRSMQILSITPKDCAPELKAKAQEEYSRIKKGEAD